MQRKPPKYTNSKYFRKYAKMQDTIDDIIHKSRNNNVTPNMQTNTGEIVRKKCQKIGNEK